MYLQYTIWNSQNDKVYTSIRFFQSVGSISCFPVQGNARCRTRGSSFLEVDSGRIPFRKSFTSFLNSSFAFLYFICRKTRSVVSKRIEMADPARTYCTVLGSTWNEVIEINSFWHSNKELIIQKLHWSQITVYGDFELFLCHLSKSVTSTTYIRSCWVHTDFWNV